MHKLLAEQLARYLGTPDELPDCARPFLEAVSRTYERADDDRRVLEASVESASVQLIDRYRQLNEALAESREVERELQNTLALLTATIEATRDGILVVDDEGRMVRMNRRFVELWRIPDEIVESRDDGRAIEFVLDQLASPEEFVGKIHELYGKPEAESLDILRFKDGRIYERSSTPQRVNGEIVGRVWSFRDITTGVRLEEQLRQSQKLEAIGSLAGGIAHDFNNLLTVITGHLTLVLQGEDLSAEQREDLESGLQAAERAASLTQQLLAFARRQVLVPTSLNLNDIVAGIGPMLSRLIGADIRIETELDPDLPAVLADPGQLEQVIVNLAVNARDAMPDGGRLTIGTRIAPESEGVCGPCPTPGREVELWVSDTGCGISPVLRDRIFEPFFTTKPQGKGTGLGLATVYGIVAQSGGRIVVESEENVGSTFRVRLPGQTAPARPAPEVRREERVHGGRETILVAEDGDAVRRFVTRSLEQQGYTVLSASTGAEALVLAQEYGEDIDLVLTDVVMPGMSGQELAARVRELVPPIPVIFMSGYTDDEVMRRGVLAPEAVFLQKPFAPGQLAAAIDEAFARVRAAA